MASAEYSISILDPLETFRLVEEISSLLCVDRPEFAPLFGKDHRRRMEEDFRMEEVRRERKAKEERTGEQNIKRGLLAAVASTSSGELVAHACIISSPGQVRLFTPKLSVAFLNLILSSHSTIHYHKCHSLDFLLSKVGLLAHVFTHPSHRRQGGQFLRKARLEWFIL